MKKSLILLFALINTNQLIAIIILVHGTFATESPWCHPEGKFYQLLEKQAHERDDIVVPFNWSGKLTNTARLKAAESLAKVILSYSKEKVTLIGFSHGGNVINLTSQLLSKHKPNSQDPLAHMAGFMQIYRKIRKMNIQQKKYLINKAYLLATPIDVENYAPNMTVIGHIYNFYSNGDIIQPILGMYDRKLVGIERSINFRTIIHNGMEEYDPSHEQMHHSMIAPWILSIPDELKATNRGNFHKCNICCDGTICFYYNREPIFKQ